MQLDFVRPDASQLAFRLYDRILHPELFQCFAEAEIESEEFRIKLQICEAGHTVAFRNKAGFLTEVMGPYDQDLPERGRCVGYRLRGARDADVTLPSGISYQCNAQIEFVEPIVYSELHEEFRQDLHHAFLSYEFPSKHRFAPPPLSLIQAELTHENLLVHAFHTFPEVSAILRTQTLIRF